MVSPALKGMPAPRLGLTVAAPWVALEGHAEADRDNTFAARAHPARRENVRYLATPPTPPTMSAVAAATGVTPQMLTKHALILERAGTARRAPSGRATHLIVKVNGLAETYAQIALARAHTP